MLYSQRNWNAIDSAGENLSKWNFQIKLSGTKKAQNDHNMPNGT